MEHLLYLVASTGAKVQSGNQNRTASCEDRRMAEKMIEVAKHKGETFEFAIVEGPIVSSGNNGPRRKKRPRRSSNQFPGPQNKAGSQAQLAAVYDGALPVSLGGAGNSTR